MTKPSTLVKGSNSKPHQGIQPKVTGFHVNFDVFLPNFMNLILSHNRNNSNVAAKISWDRIWDLHSGCISLTNPLPRKIVTKLEKTVKNNNKLRRIYSRKSTKSQ